MKGDRLIVFVGGILFCCAVTILFNFSSKIKLLSDAVYASDLADSHVMEEGKKDNDGQMLTVRYEQIVSEFMNNSLPYDLFINGLAVQRSDYNLTLLPEFLPSNNYLYKKTVVHDDNGNVKSVYYDVVR